MSFYQECLGGELYLQKIEDSPMADKLPQDMRECILHSSLQKGNLILMATDMVGDEGLIRGNAVSVLIQCSSEQEMRSYYDRLSVGGQKTYPIENTMWGTLFGELIDRYGNHWLLKYGEY
ncbi:hypothetical protein C900_03011 [Fulvivirga imtechensis AK7]|uniref:Uncharacterized protein n=2 Tax=Fulvivirga TaxID=396811 RepID=L8JVD9_9BACT|nr:hypothetical protein C900_03011 [Fulvivirga imtechensis AK7]